jgi:hypothetical protein
MVPLAVASLEQHVIHAERAFFFLLDGPRGELWLHTSRYGCRTACGLNWRQCRGGRARFGAWAVACGRALCWAMV